MTRPHTHSTLLGLPLGVLLLLAGLLGAGEASAQRSGVHIRKPFGGQRGSELNFHGGASHRGLGPAVGVRAAIPIVDNGFISSIDNAIYLTFGGDVLLERCYGCGGKDDYGAAIAIPVTGRWQFNFNPSWSAYGEAGPNLYIHSGWLGRDRFPDLDGALGHWFSVVVGGKYHFAQDMSLTLSLGFPYSHVGIDIPL